MSKIVIDVSAYNGVVDWKKVKAAGVDAAILKVIRKDLLPDKRFEANWEGCEKAGMALAGVYNYSYATSVAKAIQDAQKVLDILNGRKVKILSLIHISGPVVNPSIYHVEEGESITVGTSAKRMEMAAGDKIVITTETNNKHAYPVSYTHLDVYKRQGLCRLQNRSGLKSYWK